MAAAIPAFSGKHASSLVRLRLPAFEALNLNLSLNLNLPQFAEWQHIQVKSHVEYFEEDRKYPETTKHTARPDKVAGAGYFYVFPRISIHLPRQAPNTHLSNLSPKLARILLLFQ
ncbi:MAG: hypothetical protein J5I98_36015 [Phaeodactylibacter sp.]|nr:hypothetical protein [Phaeodactylibacter sp.]